MAYITKRGNSYSVRYTYEDEHGKSCDKWESFPTKEEATNRKKQIEHELAAGNPVYDLVSVKKDEGFVATATVALQPELNLTKTTGFTAE